MTPDHVSGEVLEQLLECLDLPDPAHGPSAAWVFRVLSHARRLAALEATLAYEEWRRTPGPNTYGAFRAAQDQADAAQDALARAVGGPLADAIDRGAPRSA
jgi:hypothetical protein